MIDTPATINQPSTGITEAQTPQSTDVGQSIQKTTIPFEPTKGMLKWFEVALELGYTASISDVSAKAELQRSNWYDWLKKPGFVEWWDQQWKVYFDTNKWKLKSIGMKQAERNHDYWHDMMTASGQLSNEKLPNIQVNTFIAEKKDRYGL